MKNVFNKLNLEFHIIQSFPVSCLNRDESNSPKTAVVGGVERARVSSQAWKRPIRIFMHEMGLKMGSRTKKVDELLFSRMVDKGVEREKAEAAAQYIVSKIAKDSLVFISDKELDALVSFAEERNFEFGGDSAKSDKKAKAKGEKVVKGDDEKLIGKILKGVLDEGLDAIDIALFGRMIAKINDVNVDSATSFNHAISTHRVSPEADFFVAMDDLSASSGSSFLGATEFNSATYYRYVNLNLGQMVETLYGDSDVDMSTIKEILDAFIKALYIAVPGSRQASQAAYNAWDYSQILLRKGQPLQVSFEKPIVATRDSGFSELSIQHLKSETSRREKITGSIYGLQKRFEFGEDENYSLDALIADIQESVEAIHG